MESCNSCKYYDPDFGIWCVNGWSGDGSKGDCMFEPVTVQVRADQLCSHYDSGNKENEDFLHKLVV